MRLRSKPAAAAVLLTVLAMLTACGASDDAGRTAAALPTAAPPATSLPAPRTAPAPVPMLSTPPQRGKVRVEEGPFTDRVHLNRLALTGTPAVTGHLAITSDVSDVIALELRAAFYSADGRLLGTGTFEYAEEHEAGGHGNGHEERRAAGAGIDFTIPARKLSGTPAAAVVSVPVLVNE
ncbi:hypothetical protein ACFU6I_36065 [Streptomyces sp. NPDC057486]|uniref:hypothetical protein n=1 Tax=Streptomyces sp. NPDC057486 TaxID=3346145 RepID=UPI0036C2440B